jgi:hypothetical protein
MACKISKEWRDDEDANRHSREVLREIKAFMVAPLRKSDKSGEVWCCLRGYVEKLSAVVIKKTKLPRSCPLLGNVHELLG